MAQIKKNALANIVFPMVDSTDFASIESAITASDFNSGATKKFYGVNHGGSAAFTSGSISKAATLVRSGIFQQTLKAAETNYDYVMYRFVKTGCADQLLVFHTVEDVTSQLSDVNSNLLSYLTGMSGMLSDVDSQVLLNASMISDVDSQVLLNASMISDVQSAVALVATSDYLSAVHSDLASAIGGITASVGASDISDIASAVYAIQASDLSDILSAAQQGNSRALVIQSLVSDVDSQLLLNASMISDVDSQVNLLASSDYLSQVHSDLASAIGGITASVGASDISDIASAVYAIQASDLSDILSAAQQGNSRTLVIQSLVSDVDSQVLLNASLISDIDSALSSQFVWSSAAISDMHSDLGSKIGNVSVTLTASDISDIASAVTAAGVNLTDSDMSDIASRIWSEKYNVHSAVSSSFGSFVTQQIQGASNLLSSISGLVSDVDSQLLLNASMISDVDSQLQLVATSDYLSAVHSDIASAIGAISAGGVTVSNISDIASAVDAILASDISDILSAAQQTNSRALVVQSMVSDVDSAVTALNDPTAAAVADAVWDEPYSDHLSASSLGSRVQNIASSISDVDSALTVHDTNTSAAISDLDSQATATYNLVSDVDSQLTLNTSALSNVESQLDVTHSLLSDVESAVDAIWTTALTESYNADGAAPTAAQALFGILQNLTEFSINSTTITVKKLDGSTSAMTFTLDDGTKPTSRTRAT